MIFRFIVVLLWGCAGFLSLGLGNKLGNTPYFLTHLFYDNISSILFFKISHIFFELNFYKLLMAFLSTTILSFLTNFNALRIFFFLVCYNYFPLLSVYSFYFTNDWNNLVPGSTEYLLVASIPVFCVLSITVSLLGCYVGSRLQHMRKKYKEIKMVIML